MTKSSASHELTDSLLSALRKARTPKDKSDALECIIATLRSGSLDVSPLTAVPPPGSLLAKVLDAFRDHSCIPDSIPFYTVLTLTAAWLVEQGVTGVLARNGTRIIPTLFTLVLAESGACKTWTWNQLQAAFPPVETLTRPKSPEGMMAEMQRSQERRLREADPSLSDKERVAVSSTYRLLFDELGAAVEGAQGDPKSWATLSAIFLDAHTHADIDWTLKKEGDGYHIRSPKLTVLGYAVDKLLHQQFPPQTWVSGMMQRFILSVATPRPGWQERLELHHLERILRTRVVPAMKRHFARVKLHQEYVYSARSLEMARVQNAIIARTLGISLGYAQRSLFNMYKFALLFHVLAGKDNATVDVDDMQTAVKAVRCGLGDLKYLMQDAERTDIAEALQKAIGARERLEAGEIKGDFGRTWLRQHVRGVDKWNVELIYELVEREWEHRALVAQANAPAQQELDELLQENVAALEREERARYEAGLRAASYSAVQPTAAPKEAPPPKAAPEPFKYVTREECEAAEAAAFRSPLASPGGI